MNDKHVSFIYELASLGNPNVAAVRNDDGSYRPQRRKPGMDAAAAHLADSPNYGMYPVVGKTTQTLVIDIDNHEGELPFVAVATKAKEIFGEFVAADLRPHMFRSGGGKGIHIWVCFEKPLSAARVRAFANKAISQLGLAIGTKGLVHKQVEIFPKQDSVEGDSLGNLIALPLGRLSRAIDPLTLEIIEVDDFEPPSSLAFFSAPVPASKDESPADYTSKPKRRSVEAEGDGPTELEALRGALGCISADYFEVWRDVGFALKLEFGDEGFALWHEWSRSSIEKYEDEDACRKRWETFKPNGKLTIGSIYHRAKEGGWNGKRPSPLVEMNRKYAVLTSGTRTAIILKIPNQDSGEVFQYIGKQQLLDRHKPDKIVRKGDDGEDTKLPLAETWFNSAQASRYTGIDFDPNLPPGENGTIWNLWRGFAVTPKQGSWDLFKEHIRTNISSGSSEIYEWFLNWMALGVQRPGEVIGTTPVMRGLQGTGKSVFAKSYGALWGAHFITITHSDQVTGRFNSHFFGRRFVFIDEGIWGGNKKEAGIIKVRITEDYVMLEQKGVDAVKMRNRAIFMVASNNVSVVPADLGDRRWMVVDVADTHKEDQPYFAAIAAEMENGGREAMLHELLNRDITKGPNPRRVIRTQARVMQILLAESPYVKYLHSLLDQARLPQNAAGSSDRTTVKALVQDLMRNYGERHLNDVALGKLFREILPTITSRPNGKFIAQFTSEGPVEEISTELKFPPLPEARKLFELRLGGAVPWSNDLPEWQADPAFPGDADFGNPDLP